MFNRIKFQDYGKEKVQSISRGLLTVATIYELSHRKKNQRGTIYSKTPSGSGVTGGEGKVSKLPMKRQDSKSTLWYIIPFIIN